MIAMTGYLCVSLLLDVLKAPKVLLISAKFSNLPWQKVASNLFAIKGINYLLVINYFPQYIKIAKLTQEKPSVVITHLKSIFARHRIPQEVMGLSIPQKSFVSLPNKTPLASNQQPPYLPIQQ